MISYPSMRAVDRMAYADAAGDDIHHPGPRQDPRPSVEELRAYYARMLSGWRPAKSGGGGRPPRPVVSDRDEQFESCAEAGLQLTGTQHSAGTVSHACNGKCRVAGRRLKYADDPRTFDEMLAPRLQRGRPRREVA
jgi:hypothetical protein